MLKPGKNTWRVIWANQSRILGWADLVFIKRTEDFLRDFVSIPFIHLLNGHHRQKVILRIAQSDVCIQLDVFAWFQRQCHRDGEEVAVGQPHFLEHPLVIGPAHE